MNEKKLAGNINWEIGLGQFKDNEDMVYIANGSGTVNNSISMTKNEFKIFCFLIKEAGKKLKEIEKIE